MSAEMWLGVAIGAVGVIVAKMAGVLLKDWWGRNRPW